MYDGIHATCATNPDFTVLKYIDIRKDCSNAKNCIRPIPILGILDGQNSSPNSNPIYDGGRSNPNYNYTLLLDGGNSSL